MQEFNIALQPVISVALSGDVPERTLLKLARDLKDEIKLDPQRARRRYRRRAQGDAGDRHRSGEAGKLRHHRSRRCSRRSRNNNRLIAAGLIDTGHGSFAVKVPGVIENADDLLSLPIRSTANSTITLADVAQVRRTFYDPDDLCARERPADDLARRHQAHRRQHHRQQSGGARYRREGAEDLAGGRARHLSVRQFDRHPRHAGLAVGFDHARHRAGDDHRRRRARPARRACSSALRFRPRS